MVKKKYNKHYIQPIYLDNYNEYGIGGWLKDKLGGLSQGAKGAVGAGMGVLGNTSGSLISGGLSSGAGNAISGVGNAVGDVAMAINPLIGGAIKLGSSLFGGLTNKLFGSKVNQETVNAINASTDKLNSTIVDTGSSDSLLAQWGSQDFGNNFTKDDIGKDGIFSHKVSHMFRDMQKEQQDARNKVILAYNNAAETVDKQTDMNTLGNFSALGGPLNTNGADWTNGIMLIDEGGSHEENPYQGVMLGIDSEGKPNLVEEGEVVWNNYVFSNRIKPSKKVKDRYKLKGNTFADAVRHLQKESEERPNDPISKRSLDSMLTKLAMEQEPMRQKRESNKFKCGGKLYAGGGPFGMNPYIEEEPAEYSYLRRGMNPDLMETEPVSVSTGRTSAAPVTDTNKKKKWKFDNSFFRYAPILASGALTITDALGLTNKPDYSYADRLENEARGIIPQQVKFNPIGNYLGFTPMDVSYMTNKLGSQAAATRRAIVENSAGNRGMTNAGLIAADYNATNALGDAFIKAREFNDAKRERIAGFNRATDMYNSEGFFKEAATNADLRRQADALRLDLITKSVGMRAGADDTSDKSKALNLSNFVQGLGDLGWETVNRNMVVSNPGLYYSVDAKGNVVYKDDYYKLNAEQQQQVRDAANKGQVSAANGGFLTIKRKRR